MFKRGVRVLKSVKGLVGEFHMLFCSNVNSNRTVDYPSRGVLPIL